MGALFRLFLTVRDTALGNSEVAFMSILFTLVAFVSILFAYGVNKIDIFCIIGTSLIHISISIINQIFSTTI